ncbi:pre-peptidase C-terminal domain-containing protein, partial [Kurthia gibsonii]|uniref:pre-peptidase C-terminal domain-containing protein n=1 Tax=Kurthia gibsonii TaxID=33946 RepID=UPI003F2386AB
MTIVDSKTTEIEPNDGSELAMAIKPTQKPVTAQFSWSDSTDYYKVKLDQAGLLNIKMTAYMDRMYVQVFDSDLYEVEGWSDYYGGSELSGKVRQDGYYLEKGTYYIKVSQWHSYTGKYKIETKFSKTSNNEKEPNNGLEQAQKIKPNVQSVTGLISWNDSSDFYKVDVSKTGVLNVHMTVYQSMEIKIYDRDGYELLDRWISKSSNTSSDKWSTSLNVKKGTYYVQIYGNTGLYKLNVKVPEMLPKSPKAKATKTKVTGTTYANSKVTVKIGSKKYTGKSNSKGAFSIKIPTQKVKTKVYVSPSTQIEHFLLIKDEHFLFGKDSLL